MVKNIGIKTGKTQIKIGRIISALFIAIVLLSVAKGQVKSESPVSPSASILKIAHGAHIRPTIEYGQEIAAFNALVQKDLAIVMYFMDWRVSGQNGSYFDKFLVDKIRTTFGNNSPAIMLTWLPAAGKKPGCIRDYTNAIPLNDIIAGACDNYIRGFAKAIKARPERYLLRFAPEMNISDSTYWPGHYNQRADTFIQMWRHVHDVFMSENVGNVEWVWAISFWSYPAIDWNDRNMYYPGNEYLDWIGIDGYNWYTSLGLRWMTFSDIYDAANYNNVLRDLACRYAKPQIIAEFGSVEGPGGTQTKSYWIQDAYNAIPQYPFMRGIVWLNEHAFEDPNSGDFRVTTSTTGSQQSSTYVQPLPSGSGNWTNAYKEAIAKPEYSSTLQSLENATPPTTYCGNGEPQYKAPSLIILGKNQTTEFSFTGMNFDQGQTISLQLPLNSGITGNSSPTILEAPWGSTSITLQTSTSTPLGNITVVILGNGVPIATLQVIVVEKVSQAFFPLIRK